MFKKVLVSVDGSEHSKRAVAVGAGLAQQQGAKLTLLHVITHAGGSAVPRELKAFERIEHMRITETDLIESAGQDLLANAASAAAAQGITDCDTQLEHGDPASRITAVAKDKDVDLIVMGRRGLGDLGGILLGSVSHKVAQAVDCSCLTVK